LIRHSDFDIHHEVGDEGLELSPHFPEKTAFSAPRAAALLRQNGKDGDTTPAVRRGCGDSSLAESDHALSRAGANTAADYIGQVWPLLPPHVRDAIVTLIDASLAQQQAGREGA
jgi:hypothetical protein